jgi:hypothetical protein
VKCSPSTGGNSVCAYDTLVALPLAHFRPHALFNEFYYSSAPPYWHSFVVILVCQCEWRNMPEYDTRRSCGGTPPVLVNLRR